MLRLWDAGRAAEPQPGGLAGWGYGAGRGADDSGGDCVGQAPVVGLLRRQTQKDPPPPPLFFSFFSPVVSLKSAAWKQKRPSRWLPREEPLLST